MLIKNPTVIYCNKENRNENHHWEEKNINCEIYKCIECLWFKNSFEFKFELDIAVEMQE